jgi:hypothetical protein
MLIAALLWWMGIDGSLATIAAPALSIVFITLTAIVLVIDHGIIETYSKLPQ